MKKSTVSKSSQLPTALVDDPFHAGQLSPKKMRRCCKRLDDLSEISPDASPPGKLVAELKTHPVPGTVLRVCNHAASHGIDNTGYWLGVEAHSAHDPIFITIGDLVTVVCTQNDIVDFDLSRDELYRIYVMTAQGLGWGWSDTFAEVD